MEHTETRPSYDRHFTRNKVEDSTCAVQDTWELTSCPTCHKWVYNGGTKYISQSQNCLQMHL